MIVPLFRVSTRSVPIVPSGAITLEAINAHTLHILILPVELLIVLILPIELLRVEELIIDTLSGLVTSPVFVIVVIPAVVLS